MNRKSAIELSFGFILTVVIMAMVLLLGIVSVRYLVDTFDQAEYATFRSDFLREVSQIQTFSPGTRLVYDDTSRASLTLPDSKESFCVIDLNSEPSLGPQEKALRFATETGKNALFLYKMEESFDVEDLIPEPNPVCFKGRVSMVLAYIGDGKVRISEA